jgi:putative intracellular protease/amidase
MKLGTMAKRGILAMALVWASGAMGCTAEADEPPASSEDDLSAISSASIDTARTSGDPVRMARALRSIASNRLPGQRNTRTAAARRLLEGLPAEKVEGVRAAYIQTFDEDPEITIRSDGLFRPLLRLERMEEAELVAAVVGARMEADVANLVDMFERAQNAQLTEKDRRAYFAMLPRMGLWDAPVRAKTNDTALDALERGHLARVWASRNPSTKIDAALKAIEAKLPLPSLAAAAPRERSVAVIASSHGAQWQELMGWAKGMLERGYSLQVFTPDGRPVAFQRDSLSVSKKTVPLGFGCPPDLDPAGPVGRAAAELLGRAAGASQFDASRYGAVYLAGGLGFNDDVAVAMPGAATRSGTKLTANPNIASMMEKAVAERLPMVALCHGPTLFAAVPIRIDGKDEPLARGIETASLPPFESYVGFTERKEIQFTYDVNTHDVLSEAGAKTAVLFDIGNMSRVVKARKGDIDIISGPGPQAASSLVAPTVDALARRWAR